jgi:O104-antigen biosynthesis beta-1,3-galactosyltransferase
MTSENELTLAAETPTARPRTPAVSVLMAVHQSDDPAHLADALDSLMPFIADLRDTVLVSDGPLADEHEQVIASRHDALKIRLIRLSTCAGLGNALNKGLEASDSEFVLRMDSDDISRPERLAKLLTHIQGDPHADVVGSFIAEFHHDPTKPAHLREVPLTHEDITAGMRRRCTMNHVSCLVRRHAALAVGGYEGGRGFAEDWWLWARLVQAGHRFANVPDVLVDVRIGNGFIARRRGWRMLRQDFRLLAMMRKAKFITPAGAVLLCAIKLAQRTLPARALNLVYRRLRTHPQPTEPSQHATR